MSSSKKDKTDITRIEDLQDFEHEETEDEDLDIELSVIAEESIDDSVFDPESDFLSEEESIEEEDTEEVDDLDQAEFDAFEENDESDDFFNESIDEAVFDSLQEDEQAQDETDNTPAIEEDDNKNVVQELTKTEPLPPIKSEELGQIQESLNAISYSTMTSSANPPFSLKMTSLKYKEDIKEIMHILKSFNIVTSDNEGDFLLSLNKGKLLIPRIGEYIAISLAHQLRKFDGDMVMGLAEDIQSSNLFNDTDRGLISKQSLKGNFEMSSSKNNTRGAVQEVILTTTTCPEGFEIHRHLGVASESTLIDMGQYTQSVNEVKETFEIITETDEKTHPLSLIYQSLSQKLKTQAFNQFGNGVTNLNYQINPIVSDVDPRIHYYQIVCSGDIVVLNQL